MYKLILLINLLLSFSLQADFSNDSVDGVTTIIVYDKSISREGSIVKFTQGIRTNIGKISTDTYEESYDCKTHRNSSIYLAPGTLGRTAAEYACLFSTKVSHNKITKDSASLQRPKSGAIWIKENKYGMRTIATDATCLYPDLKKIGYENELYLAIPRSRLRNIQDAYSTDTKHAITLAGCWSKVSHSYIAFRKHDNKIFTEKNFYIDNTWTELEKSQ